MVSCPGNSTKRSELQFSHRHICYGCNYGWTFYYETSISRVVRTRPNDLNLQSTRYTNQINLAKWFQTSTATVVQVPAKSSVVLFNINTKRFRRCNLTNKRYVVVRSLKKTDSVRMSPVSIFQSKSPHPYECTFNGYWLRPSWQYSGWCIFKHIVLAKRTLERFFSQIKTGDTSLGKQERFLGRKIDKSYKSK